MVAIGMLGHGHFWLLQNWCNTCVTSLYIGNAGIPMLKVGAARGEQECELREYTEIKDGQPDRRDYRFHHRLLEGAQLNLYHVDFLDENERAL